MSRRKKNKWQSAIMNNNQYRFYYELLEQMACSIYRWENLPPEIDKRFLEITLFNRGLSVFFFDEDYNKYFSTMGTPSGTINMYNNPTRFMAYGSDGFHKLLNASDCVPIWNNYLRRPDINAMKIYARRLADIDRTIDVNLSLQKSPLLLQVPESQRLTVQNLIKQTQGNEPIIVGRQGLMDEIDATYINADVPYLVDKLLLAKFQIWSEIMTYFGIDNQNIQKAERVQTAEVNANIGQIESSRLIRLNCRREACEHINDKYGLNIWVDFNSDISSRNFNAIAGIPDVLYGGEE